MKTSPASAPFSEMIREAFNLVHEVRELTGSEAGMRRVETAVDAAAHSMGRERLRATDHAAWRVGQLILLATFLASLYTAILLSLRRRRQTVESRLQPKEKSP